MNRKYEIRKVHDSYWVVTINDHDDWRAFNCESDAKAFVKLPLSKKRQRKFDMSIDRMEKVFYTGGGH